MKKHVFKGQYIGDPRFVSWAALTGAVDTKNFEAAKQMPNVGNLKANAQGMIDLDKALEIREILKNVFDSVQPGSGASASSVPKKETSTGILNVLNRKRRMSMENKTSLPQAMNDSTSKVSVALRNFLKSKEFGLALGMHSIEASNPEAVEAKVFDTFKDGNSLISKIFLHLENHKLNISQILAFEEARDTQTKLDAKLDNLLSADIKNMQEIEKVRKNLDEVKLMITTMKMVKAKVETDPDNKLFPLSKSAAICKPGEELLGALNAYFAEKRKYIADGTTVEFDENAEYAKDYEKYNWDEAFLSLTKDRKLKIEDGEVVLLNKAGVPDPKNLIERIKIEMDKNPQQYIKPTTEDRDSSKTRSRSNSGSTIKTRASSHSISADDTHGTSTANESTDLDEFIMDARSMNGFHFERYFNPNYNGYDFYIDGVFSDDKQLHKYAISCFDPVEGVLNTNLIIEDTLAPDNISIKFNMDQLDEDDKNWFEGLKYINTSRPSISS